MLFPVKLNKTVINEEIYNKVMRMIWIFNMILFSIWDV